MTLINRTEAVYPQTAIDQGLTGTTVVKVAVSSSGSVAGASIFRSANNAFLDGEAVRTAKASTYLPAIKICQPIDGFYFFTQSYGM